MAEPYLLPVGWRWEPLETLAEVRTGVAKGRALGKADTVQRPYLRVANVQNGYLDLREVKQIEIRRTEIERYSLKPKDVLFTEGGDRDKLGRGAVWQGEIEECVHQNHVFAARLQSSEVMPEWISLASQAQYARDYFMSVARQTVNLASINATNLRALPVPVPPIEEQRQILARMQRLVAERSSASNALERVMALLKRFRQAVLAAAFSGKLTEHDPNDEPAAVLLERIREDKQRRREGGRIDKSTKKDVSDNRPSTFRALPRLWQWSTVESTADVVGGIQKTPARIPKTNAHPYLRVANVLRGRLDLSEVHEFEVSDAELEKWELKAGDVLIVEGNGSLNEIGRCALWNGEIENCVHQNHIIRVRFDHGVVPAYFQFYLNSTDGRRAISSVASSTSGLFTLSVGKVQRITFPLAPLAEQVRIVRRIEELFAQSDAIDEAVEAARRRAEKVDQAILARAFRGEL